MMQYLQKALSGTDASASSRRLVTFIFTLVAVIVILSIVVLAYKVSFGTTANDHSIDAISKLIELTIIVLMTIFLLIGIITWQNINESASILKGLPTNVSSLKQTLTTEATEIKTDVQNGGIQQ